MDYFDKYISWKIYKSLSRNDVAKMFAFFFAETFGQAILSFALILTGSE